MSTSSSSSSGGIGIVGALGVLFVALKLLGIINWSWWWVTAPFWGGAVAVIMVLCVVFVIGIWATSNN